MFQVGVHLAVAKRRVRCYSAITSSDSLLAIFLRRTRATGDDDARHGVGRSVAFREEDTSMDGGTMRAISRLVIVAALLAGFAPGEAHAQRWTADLGINGGFSWYSEALDEEAGLTDGGRFAAGWLLGTQLTVWPSSRFGIRANGTYSERPLKTDEDLAHLGEDSHLFGNVNLWSGSIDALIRLREVNDSWMGREVLPYIALGLGGKWINPAGDRACTDSEGDEFDCNPIFPTANVADMLLFDEGASLMGLLGLGADVRMSPRSSLRLELNDRIYKPKFYAAEGGTLVASNDDNLGKIVHEIGAQIGLHLLFGVAAPPPVVVAPPPPPPPPPAPTPEPAPREDAITVCVIDPSATGGIRMQAATYRHAQRDTIVMVGGTATPIATAVGTGVMTARSAGWYMRGEPLEVRVNNETLRYLPYQTGRVIEPNQIVYVGNVNGYPVYADRDEVADVITAINTARAGRTDAELGTILAGNAQIRNAVQGVSYMYVPLDPYGCRFQPLALQDDVRKGGK
jgi:hypothetical protein